MAIEPVTREERFLAAAGGRNVTPPTPITRKEQLLQGIIDAVKSGGATPDVIENAVNNYLDANPVQPGATTAQAAQIEQNKNDIADLQDEIEEKQPKGDYVKTVNGNKPDASGNVVVATGGNGSGENVNCLLTVETITIGETGSVPVTGITLDYSTISLTAGESMMLAASVAPSDATNNTVLWESSNTSIATVNNGYVTAVAEGDAVITAYSAEDSSIKATCSVTVAAESGGDEPGGETGGKIYFSTLTPVSAGMLLKNDGKTEYNLGTAKTNGYYQLPYSEGMFVSTYHNSSFNGNYPAIMVVDNGTCTVIETENTVLSGSMTVYTATLTGFSDSAVVYVNTSTTVVPGYVIEDYMYYIPGGAE